jgi:hypothetical protein
MTDPLAERGGKSEQPAKTPAEYSTKKKAEELALDLAEEWTAPPENQESAGN